MKPYSRLVTKGRILCAFRSTAKRISSSFGQMRWEQFPQVSDFLELSPGVRTRRKTRDQRVSTQSKGSAVVTKNAAASTEQQVAVTQMRWTKKAVRLDHVCLARAQQTVRFTPWLKTDDGNQNRHWTKRTNCNRWSNVCS